MMFIVLLKIQQRQVKSYKACASVCLFYLTTSIYFFYVALYLTYNVQLVIPFCSLYSAEILTLTPCCSSCCYSIHLVQPKIQCHCSKHWIWADHKNMLPAEYDVMHSKAEIQSTQGLTTLSINAFISLVIILLLLV